jgi:MFS family permease
MKVQDEPLSVSVTPAAPVNARLALTLLVLINLFNYIDRQVLAAVVPEMKEVFFPVSGDQTAEFWMGMLQFAFLISYMLLAPLFGLLADRMSRWYLIGLGVLLWTVASGASGIDWGVLGLSATAGYVLLFLTRCFVGVGEAAYGPVAPAMISDLFPVSKRGKVMAWFYLAIPVGGALGYALGGEVTHLLGSENWHWAFYLVVPPGLVLGCWCFLMRDPPRGMSDAAGATAQPPARVDLKMALRVLRIPSYRYNTLGMTAMTFAIGGLAFWMPDYFKLHNIQGIAGTDAKTTFGVITALAGFFATMAGGLLGDALRPRFSGSYFIVSGAALMLGFPMVLAFLATPFPAAWIFVFAVVFCLFFNTGPTNTILANVTHPSVRASSFALNILIIHLFGDAISPPLIGLIARVFSTDPQKPNFEVGFMVVSATMLVGGVFWLWGARYLEQDTQLAPTRI